MNYSEQFQKSDFTQGAYPEAHTIAGKKVPPDGMAQPDVGEDGFMRYGREDMPIGLSYPAGVQFGPFRQMCGEGLFPSFGINFFNSIPFSCGSVHPHTALLLFSLVLNQRPRVIIETGTFYGYSTWFMAEALRIWGDEGSMLYTIDVTDKLIAPEVKEHPKVKIIIGDSRLELPALIEEVGEVQFSFLDSYKRIAMSEFSIVHKATPPGGMVVFHDTTLLATGKKMYEYFHTHPDLNKTFEIMLFAGTPHKENPHRFFGNADDRGLFIVRRKEGDPFLGVADYGTFHERLGDSLL